MNNINNNLHKACFTVSFYFEIDFHVNSVYLYRGEACKEMIPEAIG